MRVSRGLFTALAMLFMLSGPASGQITDGSSIGELDYSRQRTKHFRDARQTIDDLGMEDWRRTAYLLLEMAPLGDDRAALVVAERDRLKLLGVEEAEPRRAADERLPGQWFVEAGTTRVKIEVNYYQVKQRVSCSVPKRLRGRPILLGIFAVYESQVECFVRAQDGGAR